MHKWMIAAAASCIVALWGLTPASAQVGTHCYAVGDGGGANGGDDLLTLVDFTDPNVSTNETDVGTGTGTERIEAAALHPITGVMYAADDEEFGTIDLVTGEYSSIGLFGSGDGSDGNEDFDDVDGLSFDLDGTLYGSVRRSDADLLIQINIATGAHINNAFGGGNDYVVVPEIGGRDDVDDLAIDPSNGTLYATLVGSGGDILITINKATGASTNLGSIGFNSIEGLGFDPSGQLWGAREAGALVAIDKNTGAGTIFSTLDNAEDYESIT